LAATTTVPVPVMVNVLPLIVPGPEDTVKATANPDVAVADKVIGLTPYVTGEVGCVKVIVCDAWFTTTLFVTCGAGLKLELPAWFAATSTVPTPVIVSVLPLNVPGPDNTLKVTGSPDVAVADRPIGLTP
jgi:hypothetical protein